MERDAAGIVVVVKDRIDDVEDEAEHSSRILSKLVLAQPCAILRTHLPRTHDGDCHGCSVL
jgi:hypothetical protein